MVGIMETLKERVMIVEDDIISLMIEEKLLTKRGYHVVSSVREGLSALSELSTQHPDVILMDMNLTGSLNGTDVVAQMRAQGNDTPVVFISGDQNPQRMLKARHLGCIDYLIKPVTPAKMDRTLRMAVNYNSTRAEFAA